MEHHTVWADAVVICHDDHSGKTLKKIRPEGLMHQKRQQGKQGEWFGMNVHP